MAWLVENCGFTKSQETSVNEQEGEMSWESGGSWICSSRLWLRLHCVGFQYTSIICCLQSIMMPTFMQSQRRCSIGLDTPIVPSTRGFSSFSPRSFLRRSFRLRRICEFAKTLERKRKRRRRKVIMETTRRALRQQLKGKLRSCVMRRLTQNQNE